MHHTFKSVTVWRHSMSMSFSYQDPQLEPLGLRLTWVGHPLP